MNDNKIEWPCYSIIGITRFFYLSRSALFLYRVSLLSLRVRLLSLLQCLFSYRADPVFYSRCVAVCSRCGVRLLSLLQCLFSYRGRFSFLFSLRSSLLSLRGPVALVAPTFILVSTRFHFLFSLRSSLLSLRVRLLSLLQCLFSYRGDFHFLFSLRSEFALGAGRLLSLLQCLFSYRGDSTFYSRCVAVCSRACPVALVAPTFIPTTHVLAFINRKYSYLTNT